MALFSDSDYSSEDDDEYLICNDYVFLRHRHTGRIHALINYVLNNLTLRKQKNDLFKLDFRTTVLIRQLSLCLSMEEQLECAIDLVFEKVHKEPESFVACACICEEFGELRIRRKRKVYHLNSIVYSILDKTVAVKLTMRSLDYLHFIGELLKRDLVQADRVTYFLDKLLKLKGEENLRYLCRVLVSLGQILEFKCKYDLSKNFLTMKEIVAGKHGHISIRLRFILEDVIQLREHFWSPREWQFSASLIDEALNSVPDLTITSSNLASMYVTYTNAVTNSAPGLSRTPTNILEYWSKRRTRDVDGPSWTDFLSKLHEESKPQIEQLTYYLEQIVENNLDMFLEDHQALEEFSGYTIECVSVSHHPKIVARICLQVFELPSAIRQKAGLLLAELIKLGTLSLNDYFFGIEEILKKLHLITEWENLAEILVHVVCKEALSLRRFHQCCKYNNFFIKENFGQRLLACLFHLVIADKGIEFLQKMWQQSGLKLSDFMGQPKVDEFIKNNNFDFLNSGELMPFRQEKQTYDDIQNELTEFLSSGHSLDDIMKWISLNVGDRIIDNQFIRILAAIVYNKLLTKKPKPIYNLLLKYYTSNHPEHQLRCLYALQTFVNELGHPPDVLVLICGQLYEDNVLSRASFLAWETSTDIAEQEGKDIAVQELSCFLGRLKKIEQDMENSEP